MAAEWVLLIDQLEELPLGVRRFLGTGLSLLAASAGLQDGVEARAIQGILQRAVGKTDQTGLKPTILHGSHYCV